MAAEIAEGIRITSPSGTLEWAVERLRGLVGVEIDPEQLYGFVHLGVPASKARARYSKTTRSFYTPRTTAEQEESLAFHFRKVMKGRSLRSNIALLAIFYRPNWQRIDADNLLKLVLDAGTKAGAWPDDSQVTTQGTVVEYDPVSPRTVVVFCASPGSLPRGDAAALTKRPRRPRARRASR